MPASPALPLCRVSLSRTCHRFSWKTQLRILLQQQFQWPERFDTDPISEDGDVGSPSSVQVDDFGQVHVVFYDSFSGDLLYKMRGLDGEWTETETVAVAETESFTRAGWEIPSPPASMFAWAPLPPGFEHMGSLDFSKQLLEQAGVAVAAGIGYGEEGEGYVRIAMVENEQRIRQAARNIKRFLQRSNT